MNAVTARPDGFAGERHLVMPGDVVRSALRHPLVAHLLPTACGHFPHAAGHRTERPAGLDESILILCTDGEGWCRLPSGLWRVRSGEALVVPRGAAHEYGADARRPWSIFWTHFRGERVADLLRLLQVTPRAPVLAVDGAGEVALLFEELIERFRHGYGLARLVAMSAALSGLLAQLAERRLADRPDLRDSQARVRASPSFMREHLARSMTLADFARAAGMSVPHYAALFRRLHGCPPLAFFLRLKVQEACQALATTDESVQAIAARLGCDDPFYFSRLFRRIQGCPPSRYRALHRTDSA